MIEKNIHQIWIGPHRMPTREKKYVNNIKNSNNEYNHILWTSLDDDMPGFLRYLCEKRIERRDYAFAADIFRLWLIKKYGGIYIDVDYEFHQPLNTFFMNECSTPDAVFFHHDPTDYTIPNGIFAAKKNHNILNFLISDMERYKNSGRYRGHPLYGGPTEFGKVIKQYFSLEYETSHSVVESHMNKENICYFDYHNFRKYALHRSLSSWFPENKIMFEAGLYE
jgi:mannosyltransferase OCH1-like enzyme